MEISNTWIETDVCIDIFNLKILQFNIMKKIFVPHHGAKKENWK